MQNCTVHWRYAPEIGDELYAFPDDYYRSPAHNETKAYLNITSDNAPWLENIPDLAAPSFENLDELDGYGLNSEPLWMRVVYRLDISSHPQTKTTAQDA